MENKKELLIVVPVYNEQASVRKVVMEWFAEVQNWTENFVMLVINDGSKDGTQKILDRLKEQLGERLCVLSRENRGHGQSCVEGYRYACSESFEWVLQIDSDGQCDPQYFFRFWRERNNYDVIYGFRIRRDDGWRRVVASRVLRTALLALQRVNCVDSNVPYRLIRTGVLPEVLPHIGGDFFLANIALAVLLKKNRNIRHGTVPIHFRERYGGEPAVKFKQFASKARELFKQLSNIEKTAKSSSGD